MAENNENTTDNNGTEFVPVGSDEVWAPLLKVIEADPEHMYEAAIEYLKSVGCYEKQTENASWVTTCPIARYITMRTGVQVAVGFVSYAFSYTFPGSATRFNMPPFVRALINHFDSDEELRAS